MEITKITRPFAAQLMAIDDAKIAQINEDLAFYGKLFRYEPQLTVKSDEMLEQHRKAA